MTKIEEFVDSLEMAFQDMGEREISSQLVGERVMDGLREIDEVAYVRFASVYRQFKDLNEFMDELKNVLDSRKKSSD